METGVRYISNTYYFNTYTIYGLQPVKAYTIDSVNLPYNYEILIGKKKNVIDLVCTFDIETTAIRNNKPYAFMYQWQFCIDGTVVFGRTWEEFMKLLQMLTEHFNVSRETLLVVYVHNLSYEFQFIKSFFDWDNVFLTKERTILRAITVTGIEFRCSYYLTNQSLELFTENMHVEHRKVKGELIDEEEGFNFDYQKYRSPYTSLIWQELSYCYNDVAGLFESITELLKSENDTLLTIPMTSTGYVRRDMKAAVKTTKYMRNLKKILPDYKVFTMLNDAFRGGDTHANYTLAGRFIDDIEAWDITSSYPYVIMVKKFPMSKFIEGSLSDLQNYLNQDKAILMTVKFVDIAIKDIWDMPYISYSKCKTKVNPKCDNGRILSADEITLTITEIDYKIIRDCYNIKEQYISDIYIADKGYLPTGLRNTTMEYFTRKCELAVRKNELKVKKKREGLTEEEEQEYILVCKNYMKSKNKLNAIYGMFATNPVRILWEFDGISAHKKEIDKEKELLDYNNKWSTFLAYQWGVYVTAYARYRLNEIRNLKKSITIYNDTDSVYWPKGYERLIREYNKQVLIEINNAPIPPKLKVKGQLFTMGTVELDGEYSQFITWGAKRYGVKTKNGDIKLTVSGLGKTIGAEAIKRDGFENFKPGWTVENCGNMTAYYNDEPSHYIKEDGHRILTGSNVALFNSSYTLNLTRDYNDLIGYIKNNI